MITPDYQGGSIVNLMASIVQARGGEEARYAPLRGLAPADLASRSLVLFVIDGLGYENLVAHRPEGALGRHLKGRITTVFPATTATAVTTFLTGLAPQQHGITGWFTYFRELGSVVAVLPYRPRHGGAPLTVPAGTLFDHVPVFDRLQGRSFVVAPEWIAYSAFNSAHTGAAQIRPYATLNQMLQTVGRTVRGGAGRNYIYAYWPELDRLGHAHGIGSREAVDHLAHIDTAFGAFLDAIAGSDTTVIVTADHGFIDTRPEETVDLDAHPQLAQRLVLPLCGERRAAYCYVGAGERARFADYVHARLEPYTEIHDSGELIESGYFGPGPAHPRLHERVGDYTLIMKRHAVIKDWLLGEERHVQVGVHGGTSAAEMYVPLIVARV